MLTIKKVVAFLRKYKPRKPEDIDDKLPLVSLGGGCYREVFAVKGLRVVIKFPYNTQSDTLHARDEIRAIEKLRTAPRDIRKHAPKVYYHDWKTGVILMKRYRHTSAPGIRLAKKLTKFFDTSSGLMDYGWGNFARDGKKLVAIDLGIT